MLATSPTGAQQAGQRVALRLTAQCAGDPDPVGLVSDDIYPDCDQSVLAELHDKLATALNTGHFLPDDGNPDLVLSVTLTKLVFDTGVGGFLGDFTATWKATAAYQLAAPNGQILRSGAASGEDSGDEDGAALGALATDIVAALPGGAANASPAASPETRRISVAAGESLGDLIAKAYRTLAVKPSLPDDARALKLKAEAALKANDLEGAGHAYLAALNSAFWWPEGHRELALILARLNKPVDAISDMRLYLKLAPDAPDAAEMQAKVAEWSKQSPPPPAPETPAMPPGMPGWGVSIVDLPSIVASAMGKPDLEGAFVTLVLTGSPAERAGVLKGDVVTRCGSSSVTSAAALRDCARSAAPGSVTELGIVRDGKTLALSVRS